MTPVAEPTSARDVLAIRTVDAFGVVPGFVTARAARRDEQRLEDVALAVAVEVVDPGRAELLPVLVGGGLRGAGGVGRHLVQAGSDRDLVVGQVAHVGDVGDLLHLIATGF